MTHHASRTTFDDRLDAALAGTHALIDLDALSGNLAGVRSRLPAGVQIIAVVKANAYGHGLVPCALAALAAGASLLAVARVEEGLVLRTAGITAPVLVLGPPNPALARQAAGTDLALAVGSVDGLAALVARLSEGTPPLALHLKVDSGMHRFGVEPEVALGLARAITDDGRLRLEGLFTHFATADEADDRFLREQLRRFEAARRVLADAGLAPLLVHLANSAAVLRGVTGDGLAAGLTAVRVGLILYGLSPSADVPAPEGFRPVMTLKTRLARVFTLAAGEGVSYGRTYIADRPVRCATLPVGYGDGLSRHLSNRGWAVVRGAVCPIRGRVCMDQTVVEVEAASGAVEGDEAILLGAGHDGAMTAERAAALGGTINYEVVTAISARVPRIYLRGGRPVAVSDLLGLIEGGQSG